MRANCDYGQFIFTFSEEWTQFFRPCNWRNFHFLHVHAEDDIQMGTFEITIVIFGLGVRVAWEHTKTDYKKEIVRKVKEFNDE